MAMSSARMVAVANWLMANNIEPGDVPIHSTIAIVTAENGTQTIRYDAYLRDEHGRLRIAGDEAVQERRVVQLVSPLPDRLPA